MRQLILVQGSQISASIYLFVYLHVCVRSGMQEVSHSVHGRTHEMNVILTISGHELLFILLDFMVQIDYGLHDECTYQAVNRYYA